jgi:hypothetical protein
MSQWDKMRGREKGGGKGDIFIMYPLPTIAWLEGGVGEARTFISYLLPTLSLWYNLVKGENYYK